MNISTTDFRIWILGCLNIPKHSWLNLASINHDLSWSPSSNFNKRRAAHSTIPQGNLYPNLNHNQHLNLNLNWNLNWGSAHYSTSKKLLNGNLTREEIDKEFKLFALLKAWVRQRLLNGVQSTTLYAMDEVFHPKKEALKVACWFL